MEEGIVSSDKTVRKFQDLPYERKVLLCNGNKGHVDVKQGFPFFIYDKKYYPGKILSFGKFKISNYGVLKIKSITLEFYGETYANSTGANNCIGDVYISNVYRINGSIANAVKNTYQGSRTTSITYPSINYYKPSKYQTKGTGGLKYVFDNEAIKIIENDNPYKLYVKGGELYFGENKVLLA